MSQPARVLFLGVSLLLVLAACGRPASRARPAPDPVAAWLALIPARCLAPAPVAHLSCPEPPPEPAGACVVERRDLAGDALADRWVFAEGRLLFHTRVMSERQTDLTIPEYDGSGRRTGETICIRAAAGRHERHPSWREPMAYYEHDMSIITRNWRELGDGGAAPAFGRITSTSRFEGRTVSYEMRLCYRHDAAGRRLSRYQVYLMSDRPRALDTMVRTYVRENGRLARLVSETRNFDLRPSAKPGTAPSYSVRHQSVWEAAFTYDAAGRVTAIGSGGGKTRLAYDDRGRLVDYAGFGIAWDNQDRLLSLRGGGATFNCTYAYDEAGRFTGARHDDGGGYNLTYGDACPPDFTHPELAPNVDNFLHYEGKDTL